MFWLTLNSVKYICIYKNVFIFSILLTFFISKNSITQYNIKKKIQHFPF